MLKRFGYSKFKNYFNYFIDLLKIISTILYNNWILKLFQYFEFTFVYRFIKDKNDLYILNLNIISTILYSNWILKQFGYF